MRPKIVIGILLLGTGLLLIILLASKAVHPQSTSSLAENSAVSVASANPVNAVKAPVVRPPPVFSIAPVAVADDPAAHEKYVVQRIKELNALAMNNDTASRDAILAEVKNNPDRRIRAAALQAAIQFDDRSVVPPLQDIAAQTGDPEEKANILAAIDYINLPSLTEYLAANPHQQSTIPSVRRTVRPPHSPQPPSAATGQ